MGRVLYEFGGKWLYFKNHFQNPWETKWIHVILMRNVTDLTFSTLGIVSPTQTIIPVTAMM
jgi:hypothetical protein